MATASTKVLSEALNLSVQERVRVAEKLLESADAEGYDDESERRRARIPYAKGESPSHRFHLITESKRPC